MMRIVAGSFGGRRLHPPKNRAIRPTSDRVREAIFSIIAEQIFDAKVLDLFAGTGAMGLEALSRGASQAVLVDQRAEAVRLIRVNVELCGMQDRVTVMQSPVVQALRRLGKDGRSFDLVFMDPPYGRGDIETTLALLDEAAAPGALLIAEHHKKDSLPERSGKWTKTQDRKYGDTVVSFLVKDSPR
jgi:16S rRNA (guanine966-N2)-methyltransferase